MPQCENTFCGAIYEGHHECSLWDKQDSEVIDLARKTLDQGLYFGNGHITRATDHELLNFARDIANKTILEVVAAMKAPLGTTEKIYVADAINRAMSVMR